MTVQFADVLGQKKLKLGHSKRVLIRTPDFHVWVHADEPGTKGPMHTHTADYHLVVIEGTMKHWAAGETEATAKPLGPGSYWFQPGGQPHADACISDKCVMHVVWSGRRDGKLAESPKP